MAYGKSFFAIVAPWLAVLVIVGAAVGWAHEKYVREPERARALAEEKAEAAERASILVEQRREAAHADRVARTEENRRKAADAARKAAEEDAERSRLERQRENELARAELRLVLPIASRWDDAVELAKATPRIALAPQIKELQSLRREMAAVRPASDSCARPVYVSMLASMDEQISMFIAFLGKNEDQAAVHATTSQIHARQFKDALATCDL